MTINEFQEKYPSVTITREIQERALSENNKYANGFYIRCLFEFALDEQYPDYKGNWIVGMTTGFIDNSVKRTCFFRLNDTASSAINNFCVYRRLPEYLDSDKMIEGTFPLIWE